jgi:ribosomal protein L36
MGDELALFVASRRLLCSIAEKHQFLPMKVRASIKVQQPGDIIVRRGGTLYRINKRNPRRKARQG